LSKDEAILFFPELQLFSNKVQVLRVLRGKIVIGWIVDSMVWIVKSDFPRRGIPVIGVFFAEGCY